MRTSAAEKEPTMTIDQTQLDEFIGQFANDFATAVHASTVVVGDKLGLYRAMATSGPTDAAALADTTGCDARLVEEWLKAQYVSGYCHQDDGRYWLDDAQAAVLADPSTPAFMVGAMTIAVSTAKDEDKVREAFRTGVGVAWDAHSHDLFHGVERLFKPGYLANLTTEWIPALSGIEAKLQTGARVADLGCGHGASTILMAQTYPKATITGYDFHAPSIEVARARAVEAGVDDRVTFEVASAQDYPGTDLDLVCIFDALHDMGDPLGAATHIRQSLTKSGAFLLVEPMAGETVEDNVNPIGRIFYSCSTFICTPSAQAQQGDYALGAQVPEATWREVMDKAGFATFKRATETPFNRVFEARP
jgi:SAM-dependent methyltransferase